MSIYRAPKVYADTDVSAPLGPQPESAVVEEKPKNDVSPWAHLRKSNPLNALLPRTRAWAKDLPERLQPVNLMAQFPRVANLLAMEWNAPGTICQHFEDLLHDRRGGRRGFPVPVRAELVALRDYYYVEELVKKSSDNRKEPSG